MALRMPHFLFRMAPVAALALLAACTSTKKQASTTNCAKAPERNDYLIGATLYQQDAAEYRALCLQSYALAPLAAG